ncbi:MAG: DUF2892 domain-containing protein [Chloroflexi bacterium]|nr:DUF2892 domain-containing protein [Chloroflexota bacterium]
MAFAKFMAGPIGRGVRIAAGILLILVGLFVIEGTGGWIVAIIGIAPVLAGAFNFCLIAPLIKAPFFGKEALQK